MAIFKVTKERAIQSDRADFFQNEFELRDFFAKNLEELLGVKFLDKEHQIPEGRIDTLGIDEDGSPVIIEYKWDEDDGILTQGQFYSHTLCVMPCACAQGSGLPSLPQGLMPCGQGMGVYFFLFAH